MGGDKTVDDLDHVVPLTAFTDASPSGQKSCDVMSLSSLLAQRHEKRFPSTPVEAVSSNLVDKSMMTDLLALRRPSRGW